MTRPRRSPITSLLSSLAVAAALATSAQAPPPEPSVQCGTKVLYGKRYAVHVVGNPLPCEQVREIIRGHCRETKQWSCFSFWPPSPALVWFRESERFNETFSTAIEARRYPCSEARVTRAAWARARRSRSSQFPREEQIFADDIIRCRLLAGMTRRQARRLLGRPDYRDRRFFDYVVGEERDSFIQIDSESLSIQFDKHGRFVSAQLAQN